MAVDAPQISFSGLSSGLKSDEIIKASVEVARGPLKQLQAKEAVMRRQQEDFDGVRGLVTELSTLGQSMDSLSEFSRVQGASDSAAVVAVAGSDAQAGDYALQVLALAQAHRSYSDGVAERSVPGLLAPGSFSLQLGGGDVVAVQVDGSSTLDGVAAEVNAAGLGVRASVLYDGSQYRLIFAGSRSGAANALSFVEQGTALGLNRPENQAQKGQDAQIALDNLPPVSRPTNVVNDLLPGVSLQLLAPTAAPAAIHLTPDLAAAGAQVHRFVDAYNGLTARVQALSRFSGKADVNSLVGDTTLRSLQQRLQALLAKPVRGTGSAYTTLAQLGIVTGKDGAVSIDDGQLQAALSADFLGVARLFVQDFHSNTRGIAREVQDLAHQFSDGGTGALSSRSDGLSRRLRAMTRRESEMNHSVEVYERTMRRQFVDLEHKMAQLKAQGAAASQGFANLNN